MSKRVTIIGAGRIGSAIAGVLKNKGYNVSLWDKDPKKNQNTENFETLARSADIIFLCTPSSALREVCKDISKYVGQNTGIVSLSKGIERETKKFPDEILKEFFNKKHIGILGGPMLAEELEQGLFGAGVLGVYDKKFFHEISDLFSGTSVSLALNGDIHGVSVSGVLKNVYSLAFGIADGLQWSGNAKGWLLTQSMAEIPNIVKIFGGKKETSFGIAGLGDLATCGFSKYSRNRLAGEDVLEDGKFDEQTEGVISAPSVFAMLGNKTKKFRILSAIEKIMDEKQDVGSVFNKLFISGINI